MDQNPVVPVAQELIQQGLTIMRVENETQQAMAIQKPRNLKEIWDDVSEELEILPEFAAKAYYSIPYKNDQGGTTNVEGPSIKSAMTLCRRWGNCANGARVVDEREDRIIVEGVFMDYETNVRTTRQVSVSKNYWSKATKRVTPLRDDRLNMAIQAGMSKAVRNAILASLPVGLVDGYVKAAKGIVVRGFAKPAGKAPIAPKDRLEAARKKFLSLGVDPALYDDYIASRTEDDDSLLANLLGLFNSIEDGQVKIEDVFGVKENKVEMKGQVSEGELFNGK